VNLLVNWLIWMFGPTLCVIAIAIAIVLSLLPIKVPEVKPGPHSWWKEPDA
jgi:hypothetical protein